MARASRRRSWLPAGKFGRVGGGSFQLVSQGAPIKATLLSLERELRIRVSRPSFEGGDFILPSDETEALDTIDALLRRLAVDGELTGGRSCCC